MRHRESYLTELSLSNSAGVTLWSGGSGDAGMRGWYSVLYLSSEGESAANWELNQYTKYRARRHELEEGIHPTTVSQTVVTHSVSSTGTGLGSTG